MNAIVNQLRSARRTRPRTPRPATPHLRGSGCWPPGSALPPGSAAGPARSGGWHGPAARRSAADVGGGGSSSGGGVNALPGDHPRRARQAHCVNAAASVLLPRALSMPNRSSSGCGPPLPPSSERPAPPPLPPAVARAWRLSARVAAPVRPAVHAGAPHGLLGPPGGPAHLGLARPGGPCPRSCLARVQGTAECTARRRLGLRRA